MKLIEITQKYFSISPNAVYLFEAYSNPEAELTVKFSEIDKEFSALFYKAFVYEQSTGNSVVLVTFQLNSQTPNIITIDNINPTQNVETNKLVHTTAGPQISGVDMGHVAIKWLFKSIKEFAKSKGFDIKKIVSSTRYTGARAKNNPSNTNMPDTFDVNVNVKEEFAYYIDGDVIRYIFE